MPENAMSQPDIERVAARIFADNRNRAPFRPLRGADAPPTLTDAYRIQDCVHNLFEAEGDAGPLGGHKIALTSRAVQALCGVDQPAYGGIFAKTIHRSPAVMELSEFVHAGLEFELAVEISRDAPPENAPYDRESIARHIRSCAPAFELIEDRNADYGALDAASILTDRCWCAGIVLGPPVTRWDDIDLATVPVTLAWNGVVCERGVAGASMGHPFEGLAWVANHLAQRGRGLTAGEIVMTGSALATRFPEAGDEIIYAIEGLGETRLNVAP